MIVRLEWSGEMSFQLKAKESITDGTSRIIRRELEKLLDQLGTKLKSEEREAWEIEIVHEVRKTFKKVRAALRLIREGLGDDIYHKENWCFRDAARPISQVRDAQMLGETLDKLRQQFAGRIEPEMFKKMHDALLANQREVTRRVLKEDKALAAVKEVISLALARISDWKVNQDGWAVVESGLRHVYREGNRARTLAAQDPTVANLHEWRKQAKYLYRGLQLLELSWKGHEKELGEQAHELSDLLGEDHDLAVLRQTLAADPLTFGGHAGLKGLFALIDTRRKDLQRQAFALGRLLYKDSPKLFTTRIEGYWKAWTVKSQGSSRRVSPTGEQRGIA